jgi:imidazoleglycerol-phosphate dehydratase
MRKAKVQRRTKETAISMELNLDGRGRYSIKSPVPFLDHMLSLMCKHGLFDMSLRATGDVEVDYHHTVEDIGIVLGKALRQSLGTMEGITRYGHASVPMDEALASLSLDISGRPYLVYKVTLPKKARIKDFDADLVEDFLQAFTGHGGFTLHVNVSYGRNIHHIIEAVFKGLGRTLREAVTLDPRVKGLPSTKGKL